MDQPSADSRNLDATPPAGPLEREYRALISGPALVDRSYRGLIEVTGKDRAAWLHNLTTNQVKPLSPGQGNYAFVLNIKGRILFDLVVLVRPDVIWIDLDRAFLDAAQRHFNKFIIMEDVKLADRSGDFARLAIAGARAPALLAALAAPNAAILPHYAQWELAWQDATMPAFRSDFHGAYAVELLVPAGREAALKSDLTDAGRGAHTIPVGVEAVHMHRIESAIPWPGLEITEEYLPAETRQLSRAVSFNKGCYLGQEVVERMRARHVVARQLVQIKLIGDAVPPGGAALHDAADQGVGSITSACYSPAHHSVIALGYVKTAASESGTSLTARWQDHAVAAHVLDFPVSAS